MKKILLLATVIGLSIYFYVRSTQLVGKTVEVLSVKRLSGDGIAFPIQFRKNIVIFWNSKCDSCASALDQLNLFMGKGLIKSNELIALNVSESAETVLSFLKNKDYQFVVALDENQSVFKKYNSPDLPSLIFLDKDGKVAKIIKNTNFSDKNSEFEHMITEFLRKN